MKFDFSRTIIFIMLFCFSSVVFAQDEEEMLPEDALYLEAYRIIRVEVSEFNEFSYGVTIDSVKSEFNKEAKIVSVKKAIEKLSESLFKYPNQERYFRTLYYKGRLEYFIGDYENAKSTLRKAVAIDVPTWQGYQKRCAMKDLIFMANTEKDFKQAIAYLKLLKKDKNYDCGNDYQDTQEFVKNMLVFCKKRNKK